MGDTTQSLQYSNDRPTAVTLVDKNGNAITSFGSGGSGGTTNNNTTNNNTTNNNNNTTNNNTTNSTSTGAVTLLDALSNPYGARNPLASKITDPYYADRIMQVAVDGSITALSKDYLLTALQNAQMFTAVAGTTTNGFVVPAANIITAMCVFNPAASKKNILILEVRPIITSTSISATVNSYHNISRVTADPGFAAITPSNCMTGGAVSISSASYANSNQAVQGTIVDTIITSNITPYAYASPNFCYLLPAATASGLVCYCNMFVTITNPVWSCSFRWLEF